MKLSLVFVTVFVIAACGLGYELVAGALSSYLLGDSVTQFSTAIGLYLFALGIGAWLSKFIKTRLIERFIDVECSVALLGGTSAAAMFLAFGTGRWFRPVLYGEILAVGILVGLEVPLLLRILKDRLAFKDLVSKVLTFDYVGALLVSLAFPLILVPKLGLVRTALALGLINGLVALWSTWLLESGLRRPTGARFKCVVVIVLLVVGIVGADRFTELFESELYADEIIYAETTPYQRVVVTQNTAGFQLFLNGALQFSSADEYRYHEALVHPAMAIVPDARRALVLGGGDGLAVRELLRYPSVESVTVVDIDPEVTRLATTLEPLVALNRGALKDERVTVVNDDALHWLEKPAGIYDVVIADFPDPASFSLGKLYSTLLYRRIQTCLAPEGALAIQSTSPLFARRAYWCICRTLEESELFVRPYHAPVPSFGVWGFALASRRRFEVPNETMAGLKYLDGPTMEGLFRLPPDIGPVDVEANHLNEQLLVRYYEEDWRAWN